MHVLTYRNPHLYRGITLTILVWILMGVLSALVKSASFFANASIIVFFQYAISLVFTLPIVLSSKINPFAGKNKSMLFLRSFLGICEYILFFYSISLIPLIDSTLLLNTAPLFVPLILILWAKQKMIHKLWIPIIIGFIGVFCILKPGADVFQIGSLIALLAGICQAAIMVCLRLISSEPPLRITFNYLLLGTIVLFPFPFIYWKSFPFVMYLELFFIGGIFALVQYLFTKSFQYESPHYLAPFSYVFVIVSALLDWWFWGHVPSLLTWIGSILIILGGILTIIFAEKKT